MLYNSVREGAAQCKVRNATDANMNDNFAVTFRGEGGGRTRSVRNTGTYSKIQHLENSQFSTGK